MGRSSSYFFPVFAFTSFRFFDFFASFAINSSVFFTLQHLFSLFRSFVRFVSEFRILVRDLCVGTRLKSGHV